jgi:hypothetical protein
VLEHRGELRMVLWIYELRITEHGGAVTRRRLGAEHQHKGTAILAHAATD